MLSCRGRLQSADGWSCRPWRRAVDGRSSRPWMRAAAEFQVRAQGPAALLSSPSPLFPPLSIGAARGRALSSLSPLVSFLCRFALQGPCALEYTRYAHDFPPARVISHPPATPLPSRARFPAHPQPLSLPARAQLPFPLHLSLLRRPSDALATTSCARRRHRQEGCGVQDVPIGSSQRRLVDA